MFEASFIGVTLVAVIGLVVWAKRGGKKMDRALTAALAERGFTPQASAGAISLPALRFEGRLAFGGVVGSGLAASLVFGRGMGKALTATVTSSMSGSFSYVCVALPPATACDDAWLGRWSGPSRAVRLPDGGTVVYWQLRDTIANVDRILAELAAALP